jgi:copper chaperone CopZ
MPEQRTHTFHVSGMHCKACTVLIEDTFTELPHVDGAEVSLGSQTVRITEFSGMPEETCDFTSLYESGYTLSTEMSHEILVGRVYVSLIAFVIIGAFIVAKLGHEPDYLIEMSYSTAFIIGYCICVVVPCDCGWLVPALCELGTRWRHVAYPNAFSCGRIGGSLSSAVS